MGKHIKGEIVEVHFDSVIKEIKGKKIKRNGSHENPAYYVKSEVGNFALKLHSEVFVENKNEKVKLTPKMFK